MRGIHNPTEVFAGLKKDYIDDSFADKYGYGGWIHSDDIQIIEVKHYLRIEEEK